jgi:N-methylhydantoinase A
MNPAHEEQTRALIHERFPAAQVSLSSEVLPRIREWARLSTTLLNAYLEPVMVRYIAHLNGGLDSAGVRTRQRFLMQSNGGVMPFSAAIAGGRTVHTLFSGPAAARRPALISRARTPAAASSLWTWGAPAPTSPSSKAGHRSK